MHRPKRLAMHIPRSFGRIETAAMIAPTFK
jgi:hypothetical protein